MKLLDLFNRIGKDKRLFPLGRLLLLIVRRLRLSILCRIAGRRLVTAFAGAPAILLTHSTMKEALHDPELLYKAIAYTVQEMGLDTLCLFADMSLEAEACGCQVHFDDKNVPSITTHICTTEENVDALKVPDPYQDGRMPVFLTAMRLLNEHYNILKVGEVSGPFTLALQLAGSSIYVDIRKNPEKVKALLNYCQKVITRYAQALIEAGADIILVAEPSGSQLSAAGFEDFSLFYTRAIISALKRQSILHVCGRAEHLIEKMCQSGATALSIDDVTLASVIKRVPADITLIGNISPIKFVYSSPEEIKKETLSLLAAIESKHEFIVAPGCDLAPQTPLANILAFTEAAKEYENSKKSIRNKK